MRVLELRGIKSIGPLRSFHTLLLGLKMLPAYMGETYEEFLDRVDQMDAASKKKIIREAALFVALDDEETKIILSFCADSNGVPYSAENIKNLTPKDIFEAIVSVCLEVSKIKIDLVTEAEKKN